MPRRTALRVLQALTQRDAFSNIALDAELSARDLLPPDAALATTLVYGVAKRRGMLDASLNGLLQKPLRKLEPFVRDALRLGAFQLLFLDRIPPHAAVSESVSLVRKRAPHRRGLVNAVLRRLADDVEVHRERWLAPSIEDIEAHGPLPRSHVEELRGRLGEDGLKAYVEAVYAPAPIVLRVRPGHSTSAVLDSMRGDGYEVETSAVVPGAIRVSNPGRRPDTLAPVHSGQAVIQDEAAQLVAHAIPEGSGGRVLDLCAGRGGKALHAADRVGPNGSVIATDISGTKLEVLGRTAARLGITNLTTAARESLPADAFDAVIVDAPCTGVGVVRRHPEIAWRFSAERSAELERVQRELLDEAAARVKPGGQVIYCVCSDRESEGAAQVEAFLRRHSSFDRAGDERLVGPWPDGCDGFFVGVVVRQ